MLQALPLRPVSPRQPAGWFEVEGWQEPEYARQPAHSTQMHKMKQEASGTEHGRNAWDMDGMNND